MAKSLQSDVANILKPFAKAIGAEKFPLVCNNVAAFLGQYKITTLDGEWQCSARGKLTSKDKNELQMPLNDVRAVMVRFGLNVGAVAKLGEFEVNAEIPKSCIAWIDKIEVKPTTPAPAAQEPVKA